MSHWRSGLIVRALAFAVIGPCAALAASTRVVAPGGPFASVQAAIDSVPEGNAEAVVIEIAPGRYDERLTIPKTKPLVTLRGMGNTPGDVYIGGVMSATGAIVTAVADDFRCEHLTLE